MPFKFVPFSKKQLKILTWWMPGSPVQDYDGVIATGSIRSGKSASMSLSYVVWAMECFDGRNFGMAGKTISALRRNVVNDLKVMLEGRGYIVHEKRSENLLIVSRGRKMNYFYIFGGTDESSQDLVQGITLAGFYFDEVALMPESFVNQATGRCSVEGSRLWFNCNPGNPKHWFKERWIDEAEEKRLLVLQFTMVDNLSLSRRTIERYERMYSGVFYDRYILGLWTLAEGLVYDVFDHEKHVTDEPLEDYSRRYIGIDYGTQNPTVFLDVKVSGSMVQVEREYYYSGRESRRQKTDAEFADDLQAFMDDKSYNGVVVDPSAASFIAECRKRGISCIKAKNDVLDGIRMTARWIGADRLLINADCKHTIAEFGAYKWDIKAADRGEDKPVKEDDHTLDALRYVVFTVLDGARPRTLRKGALGLR